ncbi:MAG TPA: signal recognition particle-docking protein FtsY [Alphaproteobacteria bacterium]|nr:signal recognition particle-docking protein FtsY [Rhodospirillaceae bacterium]HRJ67773.1 signal recognition particle-docking protein FtsY [Alphaproteobacteria bacterium]
MMIWFFNKKKKEEQATEAASEQVADNAADVTPAGEVTPDELQGAAEEVAAEITEEATEENIAAEASQVDAPAPAQTPAPLMEKPDTKQGWFARLKSGLSLSSGKLAGGIADIFTKRKLDQNALDELEELLITADLGPATAAKLTAAIAKNRFDKEVTGEEIRTALADEIEKILTPVEKPLFTIDAKPFVILMVGVNGTGKTTTIGKLGQQFTREGKKVMLAAGDTFRAAAVAQLKVWGERIGCPVMAKDEGADAAALAYEALDRAEAEGADILMMDTAGRLQNKANLMEELSKIVRVIRKKNAAAPHAIVLVLDATVGQNAHSQLELFKEMVAITGLIVTKLDGTAKGGVLVSLAERFQMPVHAIGIGEGIDDLRPFAAADYARAIVGLDAASD